MIPSIEPEVIAGVLAGAAIFLAFGAAYYLLQAKHWNRRKARFVQAPSGGPLENAPKNTKGEPEAVLAMNRRLGRLAVVPRIRLELARAGMKITAQQWIIYRSASVLALATLGMFVGNRESPVSAVILAVLLGLMGYALPRLYISIRQSRRAMEIERQLSDAIDVMAGALEAGSSLPQSLLLVSREMQPPITEEFSRVVLQVELGMSLEDALNQLADRVKSDDVAMLISAINIQYRVGGNLARVLRTIGSTIRERVRIKGEINVLTAQQRISAYVIGLLPFGVGVMLYLMNPEYMTRLIDPGITRIMGVAALVMMVAGFLILRKLVDIKV